MTAALFLVYVGLVAALVTIVVARFCTFGTTLAITGGLGLWLLYVGALSASGVVADASRRPPGAAFILLPVAIFMIVVVARSAMASRVALAVPLWLLVGAQVFRVGVELFLHQLWREGLMPRLTTYEGGNVDILIGLSAPLIGVAIARGRIARRGALVWTILGMLALTNIVVRAIATAPGPFNFIHAEMPNQAIGLFPYTYVAGFFAPLALTLHILAIRATRQTRPNGSVPTRPSRLGPSR